MYPRSLNTLIECFKKLPGVGEKTAERHALAMISLDEEIIELFINSLKNIKTKIKRCQKCFNYTEEDCCEICKDKKRNTKTICVVESPKNLILFEKLGSYNGQYYVLNGLISPLDDINPDDLNIPLLLRRVEEEKIEEVIIAVKSSIEGETTALYISKILNDKNVKVSKIAHGVPLGADIDYIDSLTLEMALDHRQEIS